MNGAKKLYVKSFGCQMNVYDSQRMADTLAPRRLCRNRERRRRRSRHPQHLPHPRKGGGESLFRARPRPPHEGRGGGQRPARHGRGRRLRRAGRRRGNHPPRAGGRSRGRARRAITACPICWRAPRATARRSIPNFRSTTNSITSPRRAAPRSAAAASPPSSRCRKAATSSAPSASCLTRAAWRRRGRSAKSSPRSSGWRTPACAKSR